MFQSLFGNKATGFGTNTQSSSSGFGTGSIFGNTQAKPAAAGGLFGNTGTFGSTNTG